MSEQLTYYLEQNPAIAKIICEKLFWLKEQEMLQEKPEKQQERQHYQWHPSGKTCRLFR